MTDRYSEQQSVKKRKKFVIFKRKPKFDEEGNPIYVKKKKLYSYHRLNRTFTGDLVLTLFLLFGGIFMLFPLVYTVSNSLKPLHEQWLFPPNLIVKNPTFDHYIDLFNFMGNSLVPMTKYLFNSLFLCVACTIVTVLSCSMCAYVISKREFKGQTALFKLIELSLMFSAPASGIINYIIVANLNPVDSYWPLIVPCLANSFYMYILKNFMDTFPTSILEAARIDGAGEFRIFWQIVMPGCKPAWMTVILFAVQGYWGMGTGAFVFKEEMKGINAGINAITSVSVQRAGVTGAVGILMMIVPLVTFIITQSNIMETMTTSGMKD